MTERRQHPRQRVYYGGMVAFNMRKSTLECVVRNFSQFGARIEFDNAALIPDEVDFNIEHRGLSCLARLVWRDRDAAGLSVDAAATRLTDAIAPVLQGPSFALRSVAS